jgi:hypothetical protein
MQGQPIYTLRQIINNSNLKNKLFIDIIDKNGDQAHNPLLIIGQSYCRSNYIHWWKEDLKDIRCLENNLLGKFDETTPKLLPFGDCMNQPNGVRKKKIKPSFWKLFHKKNKSFVKYFQRLQKFTPSYKSPHLMKSIHWHFKKKCHLSLLHYPSRH